MLKMRVWNMACKRLVTAAQSRVASIMDAVPIVPRKSGRPLASDTISMHIHNMGFFDAVDPVRTDSAGRNVIAPLRWFGPVFLLRSDAEVARVRRGYKWLLICSVALAALATPRFGLRVLVPLIPCEILWVYLLTCGLQHAGLKPADLPKLPRGEAVARSNALMGRPLVWALRVLLPVMTILFIWGAWEFGGAPGWIGTPIFVLLNIVMVRDYFQERAYRKSLAMSGPAS